MIVISVW